MKAPEPTVGGNRSKQKKRKIKPTLKKASRNLCKRKIVNNDQIQDSKSIEIHPNSPLLSSFSNVNEFPAHVSLSPSSKDAETLSSSWTSISRQIDHENDFGVEEVCIDQPNQDNDNFTFDTEESKPMSSGRPKRNNSITSACPICNKAFNRAVSVIFYLTFFVD